MVIISLKIDLIATSISKDDGQRFDIANQGKNEELEASFYYLVI